MSNPQEHTSDDGSIWSSVGIVLALCLTLFILCASGALFWGALKPAKPAELAAKASAPASSSASAVPAVPGAGASAVSAPASGVSVSGDTVTVILKPGAANPISFDTTNFKVKAGQKVKITFYNISIAPLQHNLVVGKLGSKDKLIAASNAMLTDMTAAIAKGYIPDSPEILAYIKLLNPSENGTVEFVAPAEKGSYPYLCTFVGHAAIMNGTMDIE